MNHGKECHSKTQLRQDFLAKKWRPYPTAPAHQAWRGRVIESSFEGLRLEGESLVFDSQLEDLKVLQAGDWISAKIQDQKILEFTLLAPCLTETSMPINFKAHQDFQNFLQIVRDFFHQKQFKEIQTPTLVPCPGTEPYLNVFSTEFKMGSVKKVFFLPTSPELHLKKAIAQGARNIFEIKACFRNGEISPTHSPEFLMLEWYRSFENLESIKKDVIELIQYVCQKMELPGTKPTSESSIQIAELFRKYVGFELCPETSAKELQEHCKSLKIDFSSDDSFDDLFFRLYLEKIEPRLQGQDLQFVCDYPPSQAALARLTEAGWGDRFEVYWQGLEIANAFHELNDPVIQRQRFQEDLEKKKSLGKEIVPLDEEFLRCLEQGMPPSAGIALGLERLFMAITGSKQISDFQIFPYRV